MSQDSTKIVGALGALALLSALRPAAPAEAPVGTPVPTGVPIWLGTEEVVLSGGTIADTDFPTPGRAINVVVEMPNPWTMNPPADATHAHLIIKRAYHGGSPYGLTTQMLQAQFNTEFSAFAFPIGGGALEAMTITVIYQTEPLFADNPHVLLEVTWLKFT